MDWSVGESVDPVHSGGPGTKNQCFRAIHFLALQISSKKYPKLKEVDDVLGGKEAWENVDSTEGNVMKIIECWE